MPDITFMIGNGFDRACGMKTRYADTYDGFIKTPELSPSNAQFKKTIEKDIQSWGDFEMKMAEYARLFSSEDEFVESVRDYINYLNSYLLQQQRSFNNSVFTNNKISTPVNKEFLSSVIDFCRGLTANETHALQSILNNGKLRYSFVTFNYTSILDRLIEDLRKTFTNQMPDSMIGRLIHIHGYLNNDVILGVDDESQLSKLPYKLSRKGKRVFIKPLLLEQYDRNRKRDAISAIVDSDVICVFGLSLGESDNSWKVELANWLLASSTHHLVFYIHSYSSKSYPRANVTLRMDDADKCKESVIAKLFGDKINSEVYDQVFDQIHVPIGSTIFKIEQTIRTASEQTKTKGVPVARPPAYA